MNKVLALLAAILLTATNLHAGNGDLIVNGKLGVGTATPQVGLDVHNNNEISAGFGRADDGSNYIAVRTGEVANQAVGYVFNVGSNTATGWGSESTLAFIRSKVIQATPFALKGNLEFWTNNGDLIGGDPKMVINSAGKVGIGTTTPEYDLHVNGNSFTKFGYWEQSDIKFKKDILPIDSALDKILRLSGVSFEWIQDKKDKEDELIDSSKTDDNGNKKDEKDKIHPEDGRHYGVIAQEMEKVLPEIVKEDNEGNKAVAYMEIIPVLIEAMKEQQKQISNQQKEIEQLKEKVAQSSK